MPHALKSLVSGESATDGFWPAAEDVRSIVCFMLGEIGDLLVTTPTLHALRLRYPAASLTLLIRQSVAALVAHNPDVDHIVPYRGGNALNKALFLLRLRLKRWDLWVDLHTPTFNTWCPNEQIFRRNALILRWARTRFRLGFAMPQLQPLLTHSVPVPDTSTLQTENIVHTTLRLATSDYRGPARKVMVTPPDLTRWVQGFLEREGIAERPCIALFFGAKQSAEVWPEANVSVFLRLVVDAFPGHRFLLLGGPHEVDAANRLERQLLPDAFPPIVNVSGKTSLPQTAALIAHCVAMVSTDSGPMHIADAVGTHLVALFSSHSHLPIWRPIQPTTEVVNVPVECGLCYAPECPRGDNLCMALIRAEDVLAALRRVLNSAGGQRADQVGAR